MIQQFSEFINSEKLFPPHSPILLAVSGGADSVTLTELFYRTKQNFGIAHCNFQLRGKESDEDEAFVAALAEKMGVKFFSVRLETEKFTTEKKLSIQMAARELRYDWFEKIRKENGYHFIATAHHLNDSIETVLLNLVKGTGIAGMHGILPKNGKVIRPLLFAKRSEIETFVKENKIKFRVDSSNELTKYERNKIRLQVIPLLRNINPQFEESVAKSIRYFSDVEQIYKKEINRLSKKLLQQEGNGFRISIGTLKNLQGVQTVLFEILKPFHFNESIVQKIIECLNGESGKQFFSSSHRIIRDRKYLLISPVEEEQQQEYLLEIKNQKLSIRHLSMVTEIKEVASFKIPNDSTINCLDISKLKSPLIIRRWKKGDYFYPLGMNNKKKKISDYLIDRKIPLTEKENIYVLDVAGRIACIIGERIDERFKIKTSTEKIFVIKLSTEKGR